MREVLRILGDNLENELNKLPKVNTETVKTNVVGFIFGAIGAVAVVMIILSGIKMVTSSGDAGAVTKAKATLIYSVIGLIVALLAYAIVSYILKEFGK